MARERLKGKCMTIYRGRDDGIELAQRKFDEQVELETKKTGKRPKTGYVHRTGDQKYEDFIIYHT